MKLYLINRAFFCEDGGEPLPATTLSAHVSFIDALGELDEIQQRDYTREPTKEEEEEGTFEQYKFITRDSYIRSNIRTAVYLQGVKVPDCWVVLTIQEIEI